MTPLPRELSNGADIGENMIADADEGKSGPHGSAHGGDKHHDPEAECRRIGDALPFGRNFH